MPIPQPQGVLSGVKSSRGTVADLPVIVDETWHSRITGRSRRPGGLSEYPRATANTLPNTQVTQVF